MKSPKCNPESGATFPRRSFTDSSVSENARGVAHLRGWLHRGYHGCESPLDVCTAPPCPLDYGNYSFSLCRVYVDRRSPSEPLCGTSLFYFYFTVFMLSSCTRRQTLAPLSTLRTTTLHIDTKPCSYHDRFRDSGYHSPRGKLPWDWNYAHRSSDRSQVEYF